MPSPDRVMQAVAELYSAAPDSFVARRKALALEAKQAGNRSAAQAISALRRPTAAAAIVNNLSDDEMRKVTELGAALRNATARLDAPEMKRLAAQRTKDLAAIVGKISASANVRDEVRATLLAAIADPSAQEAVLSRALVKPIRYSGFGDVVLDDVLAHAKAKDLGRAPLHGVSASPERDEGAPETPTHDTEPDAAEQRKNAEKEAERRLAEERAQAQRRAIKLRDEAAAASDQATKRLSAAEAALKASQAAYNAALAASQQATAALRDAERTLASFDDEAPP